MIAKNDPKGCDISGFDFNTQRLLGIQILNQGGKVAHRGSYGLNCAGCRSIKHSNPSNCVNGVAKVNHWNCCSATAQVSFCCYYDKDALPDEL